ncbi:MAG: YfbM family protein [Dehalococcoidia bacterium]
MSMTATFKHVPPGALDILRRRPALIERIVFDRGQSVAEANLAWAAAQGGVVGAPPLATVLERMETQLAALPGSQRDLVRQQIDSIRALLVPRANAGRPRRAPAPLPDGLEGAPTLDIDKAWHGLHFLLTGSVDESPGPLGDAVMGGREFGPDLGYGPMRSLDAARVAETSAALDALTAAEVEARYEASAMERAGVYPGGWSSPGSRQWLLETFEDVRGFYREAAGAGHAMLLYLV